MIKVKILIVDDEVDYCMIMKSYFSEKDYDVHTASTLKEGLDIINKIKPDIIFLDNNLPDGEGWSYVAKISKELPSAKIHLISAYRQKSEDLLVSPNVTIWEKPISIANLDKIFV